MAMTGGDGKHILASRYLSPQKSSLVTEGERDCPRLSPNWLRRRKRESSFDTFNIDLTERSSTSPPVRASCEPSLSQGFSIGVD